MVLNRRDKSIAKGVFLALENTLFCMKNPML
ncbi:hypothetical protein CPRO_25830 [Anaerotignum propionicum DSM 1682]|jgi:hypothetical protein|uniref:Uncharacterized protein n=1 Tax=Anaerotignum propionicum DSM 1682 TaxID=991789 RepID=A0ABN4LHH1_ANAPI|nr:hypothetical protein CPRO_25830 [Anaerotignum propionicum DSM 1682]